MKIDFHKISLLEINDFMFPPNRPLKADFTIVLGQTLWARPLKKVVELYKSGLSGCIIFTGGFNEKLGTSEAICMANGWMQLGYPETDLIIDQFAKNTMENMINAKAIFESKAFFNTTPKINIVTINFHMRRALETFKYVFADRTYDIGIVSYPSIYCDPRTWHLNKKGRMLVMTELQKIHQYLPNTTQTYNGAPQ